MRDRREAQLEYSGFTLDPQLWLFGVALNMVVLGVGID
jgi:hypothetical protein